MSVRFDGILRRFAWYFPSTRNTVEHVDSSGLLSFDGIALALCSPVAKVVGMVRRRPSFWQDLDEHGRKYMFCWKALIGFAKLVPAFNQSLGGLGGQKFRSFIHLLPRLRPSAKESSWNEHEVPSTPTPDFQLGSVWA